MGGRGRSEEMGGFNKSQPFWRRLNLLVSMACGRAVQGEAVCMCVCVCVCVCALQSATEVENLKAQVKTLVKELQEPQSKLDEAEKMKKNLQDRCKTHVQCTV